jgi:hypothetical protein
MRTMDQVLQKKWRARGTNVWLFLAPMISLASCSDNLTRADKPAYEPSPLPELTCSPNLDGQITNAELQTTFDTPVPLVVSPASQSRTVSLEGRVGADGKRSWDVGEDYKDDRSASITARKVAGTWFAASFTTAGFTTPFDLSETTLGVYASDDTGIRLLGLVSREENPASGKTLYVYATPILVAKFPLKVGESWTSSSDVRQSTLRGLPYAGKDTYEVKVDAAGTLTLRDYTFTQALRVKTKVTVAPAVGAATVRRQTSFFFECFGEVLRAVSKDGETQEDFTEAVELRRIGLPPSKN